MILNVFIFIFIYKYNICYLYFTCASVSWDFVSKANKDFGIQFKLECDLFIGNSFYL